MLRKKSRNHADPSKRQSMFLETVSHSLGMHQSRNRSSEYISEPVLIDTTSSRIPVRLTKREPTGATVVHSNSIRTRPPTRTTHSSRSTAALKRSSMVLDGNMIRDYNNAMRGMDPAGQNATRSDSDSSITSSDSTASSLFSNGNSTNLRDLLYEELDDETSQKGMTPSDASAQFLTQSTKALFMVKDNMHEQGTWLGLDDTLGSVYPNTNEQITHTRTALEFI